MTNTTPLASPQLARALHRFRPETVKKGTFGWADATLLIEPHPAWILTRRGYHAPIESRAKVIQLEMSLRERGEHELVSQLEQLAKMATVGRFRKMKEMGLIQGPFESSHTLGRYWTGKGRGHWIYLLMIKHELSYTNPHERSQPCAPGMRAYKQACREYGVID